MKKNLFMALRLILGVTILLLLFYKIGFSEIYNTLKLINPFLLIPVLLFFLFSWIFNTLNIKFLLKTMDYKIRFWRLFSYFWLSRQVALLLPGKIGDFSLVFFLKNNDFGIGKISALLLLDKLISYFCFITIAFAGFLILFKAEVLVKLLLLVVLLLLLFLLLLTRKPRLFIRKYILRKYAKHFAGFSKTLSNYLKNHKKILAINVCLTVLRILSTSISVFFIFLSLNTFVPLSYILVIQSVEIVIGILPITPDAMGIKESIGVYLYGSLGIAVSAVAARYIIGILERYFFALLGILIIKKDKLSAFAK